VLTLEGERRDTTPPGAVRLLGEGEAPEPGSIVLRFGGAGDDNGTGVATRYELRYSKDPSTRRIFDQGATRAALERSIRQSRKPRRWQLRMSYRMR